MARRLPQLDGGERPANLVVLLREAYVALNDGVFTRLAERGHGAVRPAHGAVFQYLDDTGTTVSRLAERARMTKQAMAELVAHLERHGYVERVPDPQDRRSLIVRLTPQGRQHFLAKAQEHEGWLAEMFRGFEPAHRDTLYELLGRLRLHLAGQGAPAAEDTPRRAAARKEPK